MTRVKQGKFSFSAKIALWGWKGYVVSEERSHAFACITPITVWVVLNNESNCRLEI